MLAVCSSAAVVTNEPVTCDGVVRSWGLQVIEQWCESLCVRGETIGG